MTAIRRWLAQPILQGIMTRGEAIGWVLVAPAAGTLLTISMAALP